MIVKKLYSLFFAVALLCCMAGCKKTTQDTTPVIDDGITYEPSSAIFPNPERGFLKTLIVYSGGAPLVQTQLNALRTSNISLILRFFYLDAFKDKAISDEELALIQGDFDKVRIAGVKMVLRFGYTDDLNGTDAPFAIVSQHIDQLKPLLEANKDVIAFVQAGFIGAYGEWHSSSNGLATTDNERQVLTKLLTALPQEIMVQVRTPSQKQAIFNTTLPVTADIAYTSDNKARVGHHNDCFLTGGTDYGTYTNVTTEKQYISTEAAFVPTGGETCPPQAGYDPTCNEARTEMKLLKWTYLNLDYYQPTISTWRSSGCFDEFQTYLGYRLALVNGKFPTTAAASASIAIDLTVTNRGYAPLYNKKNTSLVLKNKTTGTYYTVPLSVDLRTCKPSATIEIKESASLVGVPAGSYGLYLRIADQAESLKSRIEYSVRLANNNSWVEENGGMNDLKSQLTIN